MKKKGGVKIGEDTYGGSRELLVRICIAKIIFGKKKSRIGSLASHLGIFDDEFEELLDAGNLSKHRSWYKKLGMRLKTHRYHSITWIDFDGEFYPLKWAHLPRHKIIVGNTRPAWVCRPTYGWVEI